MPSRPSALRSAARAAAKSLCPRGEQGLPVGGRGANLDGGSAASLLCLPVGPLGGAVGPFLLHTQQAAAADQRQQQHRRGQSELNAPPFPLFLRRACAAARSFSA